MIDDQPKIAEAQTRDCPEHRALVYESGLKSMVLLKNQDSILPLDSRVKSVAVIGPNADTLPLDGHSSSAVIPSYIITPRQGLEALLGTERVSFAKGCDINSKDRSHFDEATRIAGESDVVIFVGGLDNTVEGEEHFIKGDRLTGSADLPGVQNDLINALAAANPNLVLVVITGGQCAVNKVIENVRGLLYVTYPGQEGGRAIADILLGNENPSGKLPVSIPKNDEQLPPRDNDFMNVVITGVGYRWYDQQKIQPEFAFGSGLSYTTFEFKNLRVSPDHTTAGKEVVVQVDVTNIRTIPAFPIEGEKVHFVATLLNRGTAPTSSDRSPIVSFIVNGRHVSTSPALLDAIPAGGMTFVCGNVGEPWTAAPGTCSVRAEADAAGAIEEIMESNNSATTILSIRPKTLITP